jgi:CheY-like chemotaxis protein
MNLKILVVDDNEDVADSTARLLEFADCDVRVSYDGPSAVVEAREFRPDVCLLDLNMPRMEGSELAQRLLKQATHPMRMIALTGRWDIAASHEIHNAGFDRHLIKPVDPNELVEAVTGKKLALSEVGT